MASSVPVVDCQNGVTAVGKQITDAMNTFGAVWLTNHGVDMKQVQRAFTVGKQFFGQSVDKKQPYSRDNLAFGKERSIMGGWVAMGDLVIDPRNTTELNESYIIVVGDNDESDFKDKDDDAAALHGALRAEMQQWSGNCEPVVGQLLRAIATRLGLAADVLTSGVNVRGGNNNTNMRFGYYPPVAADFDTTNVERFGAHKDFIYISLTVSDGPGLQVCKNGKWIEVENVENGIIVFAGDEMELVTAGHIEALEHRVSVPSGASMRPRARCSMTLFTMADDDVLLRPLLEPPSGKATPQPILARQLINEKFANVKYG